MSSDAIKRFYESVSVESLGNMWAVSLDGRGVKTPARADLVFPNKALAAAVATEWEDQGDVLDVAGMHLTRLANVAIDRTPVTRAEMAQEVVRFCETDLTCHLAEHPAELREAQETAWRPIRDWAGPALGIMLLPVHGIVAAMQPAASLVAARGHADGLDDFRLTGLVFGCGQFGSALLALAVEQGEIDALDAFERANTDEIFQESRWGEDTEALALRQAKRLEAAALGAWFETLATVNP
ncbi:MAG: ATP12 family protein [Pseudomonadota bacterium]